MKQMSNKINFTVATKEMYCHAVKGETQNAKVCTKQSQSARKRATAMTLAPYSKVSFMISMKFRHFFNLYIDIPLIDVFILLGL